MTGVSDYAAKNAKPRVLHGWQIAVLIAILVIVAAATYASLRTKADVRVTNPKYEDIESTISTTGTVVPVHDYPARANFSGLVEGIYVKLGQKVHKGQVLVLMKDQYALPRVETARAALRDAELNRKNVINNGSQEDRIVFAADLSRAQTEEKNAAVNLDTLKQLQAKGSASGAEVEAATRQLNTARENLRVLQERMSNRYSSEDKASWNAKVAADRANLQAEKISFANAHITTPISGTVYLLPVTLYDFVPAGADLLSVADLTRLKIRAEFDEADMGRLQLGAPVKISWDGAPNRTWQGRIDTKPLAVQRSGPRTVGQCTITIADDQEDLPVNTNVSLVVTLERHQHVLSIPRAALYTDGPQQFVYKVEGDRLKKVTVQTGLAGPMNIEITGGLTAADAIALHAMDDHKLAPNLRVKEVK